MSTGASLFLGYAAGGSGDGSEPPQPDDSGASSNIIQGWVMGCVGGSDPAQLWCDINLNAHAENACAIDFVNRKYFWIKGLDFYTIFGTKHMASVAQMPL